MEETGADVELMKSTREGRITTETGHGCHIQFRQRLMWLIAGEAVIQLEALISGSQRIMKQEARSSI